MIVLWWVDLWSGRAMHSCSVNGLYGALFMTYPASLGRITKRVQLDQSLHARLEPSSGHFAHVTPTEPLGGLFRKISAYTDHSSGAARGWLR